MPSKPILGIVGGIGSGKSYVAHLLQELGCAVVNSDQLASRAYALPEVRSEVSKAFGPSIFNPNGSLDRKALARAIFSDPAKRKQLEAITHPRIDALRVQQMNEQSHDPTVQAFVWDSPLLIEAGLHTQCDRIIFIDTPRHVRLERVKQRGWDEAEFDRRESAQVPIDVKRSHATDIVDGTLDTGELRARLGMIVAIALRART